MRGAEPSGSRRVEEPRFEPRPRPQPRLSDPAQTVAWGGTLPGGRRAVVGGLSGLSIGILGSEGYVLRLAVNHLWVVSGSRPATSRQHRTLSSSGDGSSIATQTQSARSSTLPPWPDDRSFVCAALFGNLGGVTSGLLALDGGRLAGWARLDVIIPVSGFKRCADYDNGYGALGRRMSSACRATLSACAL